MLPPLRLRYPPSGCCLGADVSGPFYAVERQTLSWAKLVVMWSRAYALGPVGASVTTRTAARYRSSYVFALYQPNTMASGSRATGSSSPSVGSCVLTGAPPTRPSTAARALRHQRALLCFVDYLACGT